MFNNDWTDKKIRATVHFLDSDCKILNYDNLHILNQIQKKRTLPRYISFSLMPNIF